MDWQINNEVRISTEAIDIAHDYGKLLEKHIYDVAEAYAREENATPIRITETHARKALIPAIGNLIAEMNNPNH